MAGKVLVVPQNKENALRPKFWLFWLFFFPLRIMLTWRYSNNLVVSVVLGLALLNTTQSFVLSPDSKMLSHYLSIYLNCSSFSWWNLISWQGGASLLITILRNTAKYLVFWSGYWTSTYLFVSISSIGVGHQ